MSKTLLNFWFFFTKNVFIRNFVKKYFNRINLCSEIQKKIVLEQKSNDHVNFFLFI